MARVGDNGIGRIIMRRNSWDVKKQEIPVARKGLTTKEKGYGICTYTKRGVWCHA